MVTVPLYPRFAEITIQDRLAFQEALIQSPPHISEHTFTNLFIWNYYYHFLWCLRDECIWIMARPEGKAPFLLPPIGAGPTAEGALDLLHHLQSMVVQPSMHRVPEHMVTQHLSGVDHFIIT